MDSSSPSTSDGQVVQTQERTDIDHAMRGQRSQPRRGATTLHSRAPWVGLRFPHQWESDEDFMCVHFIPRGADEELWRSQLSFWSTAVKLYAQQLCYECPYFETRKLAFGVEELERTFTRENGMAPQCIGAVLRHMIETRELSGESVFLKRADSRGIDSAMADHSSAVASTSSSSSSSSSWTLWSAMSSVVDWVWASDRTAVTDHFGDDCVPTDARFVSVECLDNVCVDLHNLALRGFDLSSTPLRWSRQSDSCSLSLASSAKKHSSAKKPKSASKSRMKLSEEELAVELGVGVKVVALATHCEVTMSTALFDDMCAAVFGLSSTDCRLLKAYLKSRAMCVEFASPSGGGSVCDMVKLNLCGKVRLSSSELMAEVPLAVSESDKMDADLIKMNLLIASMERECELTETRIAEKKAQLKEAMDRTRQRFAAKRSKSESEAQFAKAVSKEVLRSQKTCIRLLKLLKDRLGRLRQVRLNMEEVKLHIEEAEVNHSVFEAMKSARKVLTDCRDKGPSVEQVTDVMADVSGLMEDTHAVTDALADTSALETEETEDDFEREYQQMLDDSTLALIEEMPKAPVCDRLAAAVEEKHSEEVATEKKASRRVAMAAT